MAWRDDVWAAVCLVPTGRVVAYSDVAAFLGHPRRARQVGTSLGGLDPAGASRVPWHRVVNAAGFISLRGSFVSKDTQRALLRAEGIVVGEDYVVADFVTVRYSFPAPRLVPKDRRSAADVP